MARRLLFSPTMLHKTRLLAPAFLALLATTAACNEAETGAYGLVDFVPDDCGQSFCDLDDGLAVDATTEIYLDGVDGRDVSDLHIETSEPWIADVIAIEDGYSPRVTIIGNAAGLTDLLAVDRGGYVVDYVTIRVAEPTELSVDISGAAVDGPFDAANTDELYFASAGSTVTVDVTAYEIGYPLMGKLNLWIAADEDLAAAIDPSDDAGTGHFDFIAPAGEHDLYLDSVSAGRALHFSIE